MEHDWQVNFLVEKTSCSLFRQQLLAINEFLTTIPSAEEALSKIVTYCQEQEIVDPKQIADIGLLIGMRLPVAEIRKEQKKNDWLCCQEKDLLEQQEVRPPSFSITVLWHMILEIAERFAHNSQNQQ